MVRRQMLSLLEYFDSKYRWQVTPISCQFSSSSKLAKTEPLLVPKSDSRWIASVIRHNQPMFT